MARMIDIKFVMGAEPEGIYHLPKQKDKAERFLNSLQMKMRSRPQIVVGLRLSIEREVLGRCAKLLRLPEVDGTLQWFSTQMTMRGIRTVKCIAVLPDVDDPRYCFAYEDISSHRLLIENILFPRRYALTQAPRLILHVYRLYVKIFSKTQYLYRGVYLRLEVA